jgi:Xaa-Pro aminopeptidase
MTKRRDGSAPSAFRNRLKKLREAMAAAQLDAFATFNLTNVRYLTGFSGSNGAVIVTGKDAVLYTDFRYASQVAEQVTSMRSEILNGPLAEEIGKQTKKSRAKRAGFEDKHLTVNLMAQLKKASSGVRWVPCGLVEGLRMIKDAGETALIRRNFGLLEKIFSKIDRVLSPGKEESAVAAELEYALKLSGGEKPAFDFIVASGKRSALPHGVASRKKILKGDVVILDWGWVLDGYHSDNTRTLFMGRPKPKMREIFEVTLEANMRAIARTAPGVPLRYIDAAARDFITKQGYGKYFGHGTGHGVGLDIHEAPALNARSQEVAREGMVFTIEPGIYLPGVGGVRIEDVVEVTSKGCDLISAGLPKTMRVIG